MGFKENLERTYFRFRYGAQFRGEYPVSENEKQQGVVRREQFQVPIEGQPFGMCTHAIVEREVFNNTRFGEGLPRAVNKSRGCKFRQD